MRPQQPRKPLSDTYNKLEYLKALEELHKRLNELIISPAVASSSTTVAASFTATKSDYVAGDVGTAADIATALNTLAAAINLRTTTLVAAAAAIDRNTAAINQLIGKLNLS